jgi:hypothetical protein
MRGAEERPRAPKSAEERSTEKRRGRKSGAGEYHRRVRLKGSIAGDAVPVSAPTSARRSLPVEIRPLLGADFAVAAEAAARAASPAEALAEDRAVISHSAAAQAAARAAAMPSRMIVSGEREPAHGPPAGSGTPSSMGGTSARGPSRTGATIQAEEGPRRAPSRKLCTTGARLPTIARPTPRYFRDHLRRSWSHSGRQAVGAGSRKGTKEIGCPCQASKTPLARRQICSRRSEKPLSDRALRHLWVLSRAPNT